MLHDREEQAKNEQHLARSIENFRRNWGNVILETDGADHARDFEIEFYYLLEQVRRVAQEPLVRHMSMALSLAPSTPIFVETPKKQ